MDWGEGNECVKMEREDKRGHTYVNMLPINMLVWPSTVSDECSLSCSFIKLYSSLGCDIALHSVCLICW